MEPLTSVFGMGTGVTTPLWPPAKTVSWELKRTTTYTKIEVGVSSWSWRMEDSALELELFTRTDFSEKNQNKLSHTSY